MVDRIKFLCTQNGTTIQKLEQATGLGNGTIRRWDNAAPSVDRLAAVASYFGVTMEYLLTGTVGAIPEGLASRRSEESLLPRRNHRSHCVFRQIGMPAGSLTFCSRRK